MVGTAAARDAGGAFRFSLDFHPVGFGGGVVSARLVSALRLPADGLLGSTFCALMVSVSHARSACSSVKYIRVRVACVEQMSSLRISKKPVPSGLDWIQ